MATATGEVVARQALGWRVRIVDGPHAGIQLLLDGDVRTVGDRLAVEFDPADQFCTAATPPPRADLMAVLADAYAAFLADGGPPNVSRWLDGLGDEVFAEVRRRGLPA